MRRLWSVPRPVPVLVPLLWERGGADMSDREGIVEETTVPQDVVDAVLDRVREYDYVTFCEIENILRDHGIDPRGNIALSFEELPNICFWANMSEAMVATYDAIRPHTDMDSAHWLTYLSDGCVLRLPIALAFACPLPVSSPPGE